MSPTKLAIAALSNIFTIKCQFETTGKTYSYLSTINYSLNSLVVVNTPWGYKIAKVIEVDEGLPLDFLETTYDYNFIVQKVESENYEAFMSNLKSASKMVQKQVIQNQIETQLDSHGISKSFFSSIKEMFKAK